MELLKERIRREGKVLPGNIIKVDGFLNHRVDTALMSQLADEFAKYFDVKDITMVLTAEASGIPLATVCAQKYGVPMVFAKTVSSGFNGHAPLSSSNNTAGRILAYNSSPLRIFSNPASGRLSGGS